MHQVFEYIHTLDDIEPALDRVYLDGKISSSERSRLQKDIMQSIRQSGVEEWFSGSWRVFNEKEILLPGGRSHRPDRVMFKDGQTVVLDYKFGEREEDSYRRKMRRYLKELSNMGYNNAVGYIWYINQEKLTKVT
jgi:CRISPR/Cas system-associated exonuclease Cas4 (RecB family)